MSDVKEKVKKLLEEIEKVKQRIRNESGLDKEIFDKIDRREKDAYNVYIHNFWFFALEDIDSVIYGNYDTMCWFEDLVKEIFKEELKEEVVG